MTHEELLAKIQNDYEENKDFRDQPKWKPFAALRAVVELHKPQFNSRGCEDETCCPAFTACEGCGTYYPCSTVQAIEKELM